MDGYVVFFQESASLDLDFAVISKQSELIAARWLRWIVALFCVLLSTQVPRAGTPALLTKVHQAFVLKRLQTVSVQLLAIIEIQNTFG